MKNAIAIKFRMIFQHLCVAILLLSACATTSFSENVGSGNGYQIWIDSTATSDVDSKGKMYYISSVMPEVGDNDKRFQEFARYLENALLLSNQGYVRLDSSDKADIVIRIGYSVGKAQAVMGGWISWKSLIVGADDLKDPNQSELWKINLYSKDGWVNEIYPGTDGLLEMAPHMAIAAMPYFGTPSNPLSEIKSQDGKKYIIIFLNDPRLTYIRNNRQAHGPAESSALPVSDLFGWAGIEVKKKTSNLFGAKYPIISSVVEGSPASGAGLIAGDIILKIDEVDIGILTVEQVIERMREAGSPMTLLIRRRLRLNCFSVSLTRADVTSAKGQGMSSKDASSSVNKPAPSMPKKPGLPLVWDKELLKTVFAPTKGQESLKGTVFWGINRMADGPAGVVILEVSSKLPNAAAQAGLSMGDIILAVDGSPVKTVKDLKEKIKMSRPYTPVNILVEQAGKRVEKTILPRGLLRLEVKAVDRIFVIPGVPPPAGKQPSSALDTLENINVLKQVIIDRASGKIEIIGSYDQKYATGPIPYLDLLKTALQYPEPKLNLVDEWEKEGEKELIKKRANVYEVSECAVMFSMPAAERERQLLIREMAAAYGITPEEYVALYNYGYFDAKKNPAPPEVVRILGKVFRYLGWDEVATAYEQLAGNTAEKFAEALKILGKESEAQAVLADKSKNELQVESILLNFACIRMMEKTGMPQDQVNSLINFTQTGNVDPKYMLDKMYKDILLSLKDKSGNNPGWIAQAKVVIGDAPTRISSGIADPVPVRIKTYDLDRNSRLARILYEADYAGKTFLVRPDLFEGIPGQMNYYEYTSRKIKEMGIVDQVGDYGETSFWFEPKRVEMQVSPDKNIVSFGISEIRFSTKKDKAEQNDGSPPQDLEKVMAFNNDWCAQFTDNYELYAQAMPAFHSLREASKVIALARWLNSEKIVLNLDSVRQERWENPGTVTGYLRSGSYYIEITPGKFICRGEAGITGGVTFKSKQSWTAVESTPKGETNLSEQLKLSSQLGEKAVDAAKSGNLENARYLSELSAQALTGGVLRAELIKLNVPLADPVELPASPEAVLLQKEMIKQTYNEINELSQDPASKEKVVSGLNQIGNIYNKMRDNPVFASDYLYKLQTGQLSTVSAPPAIQSAGAKPQVWAPCSDAAFQDSPIPLTSEHREFLNKQLQEARNRLKYINEALKNLMAINASQRAEIEKVINEISAAYDESVDRAWSVVFDLLTSLPVDKFLENYTTATAKLADAMKYRTGLLTTPLDAAAKQRVQSEIFRIQTVQGRLDDIYKRSKFLLDVFKGANYAYDIDNWNRETKDKFAAVKEDALLIGKIALDYPKLEDYLKTKSFFAGEKYWQVLAMGRMAYYGTGFYLDILAQRGIWEPLTEKLQDDLKNNIQAMDILRQKAENTYREIGCIEKVLR